MMCAACVPIGAVLTKSDDWIAPRPNETYKQITARLWGKGLTLRGEVSGAQIAAARQIKAKAGQFLLSRIDARHGAFGIVPPELDGALVSNDFPCFEIDQTKILPEFLQWYSRSEAFVDLCRRSSEGSTNRVRLKENVFLNLTLDLPSLDEQQRIAGRLDRAAELIARRSEAVAAAEAEMKQLLAKAFARCIDGAPCCPMSEVAPLVRRPVEIDPSQGYPELGVRSFGRGTFHKPVLPGTEVGSKKLFEMARGDLVFNIVFAWEGAVAIVQPEDAGRVGSHRFLTCVADPEVTSADFLLYYFQSPEGILQLNEASPGGAGRNRTLGLKKLEKIAVPIPDRDSQRWFNALQAKARRIQQLRTASSADIDALMPSLLDEVFGKRPTPA
ncbi:restriction endonuclease subunit S [Sulfitobacter sp. 1A13353]|uniref:restriction endonuclease subunit S n=1 Tax=Sulfitobacter sp. 1A13353 TaxID=3368568 RepID=UPI0037453106